MGPYILAIALSFHSFFEGIAVGLLTNLKVLINLIIGITIHTTIASTSLGIALASNVEISGKSAFLCLFGYACSKPIGIIVGFVLTTAPTLIGVIFTSMAGGIFVYVAYSEILV